MESSGIYSVLVGTSSWMMVTFETGKSDQTMRIGKDEDERRMRIEKGWKWRAKGNKIWKDGRRMKMLLFLCSFLLFPFLVLFAHQQVCDGERKLKGWGCSEKSWRGWEDKRWEDDPVWDWRTISKESDWWVNRIGFTAKDKNSNTQFLSSSFGRCSFLHPHLSSSQKKRERRETKRGREEEEKKEERKRKKKEK